ncbi:two-component system, OmpR family, sensor histidine kinase QseC [Dyella jiangningensis]|uniref:ATP-binding protein n=1 Tax=Dyella sp. AtDHG13 TaxID=1938897 RepID=UPI000884E282|nr:ATP-binding protein [Dyella sp. AtDHG13]PXV53151.1 two-component system sensor histidine kinase QseC [Dyella sp. AtDHG13]SDL45121.1 two-component system, OmpR family, sensor histidine kinase QseC [Dyella jiangningensis]
MSRSSLRARLRWLILGVIALVLVPLGIYSMRRTINEVNELSDGRLAQSARTLQTLVDEIGLPALQRHTAENGVVVPIAAKSTQEVVLRGHTYESEVGFQVFDRSGRALMATGNLTMLPPPDAAHPGFQNVRLGRYRWRLFTLPPTHDGMVVRAAERYDSRRDITVALWVEHALAPLIALPVLALLVGWAVRRGLRPLDALAEKLSARKPGSRDTLDVAEAPRELEPVLDALNGQFTLLEEALERERRFSADVAHELRTPLASTMINLENAEASRDTHEADVALSGARESLAALARRVEQLLSLARLEASSRSDQLVDVDLLAIARTVIEELAPLIGDSDVELDVALADGTLIVRGHEVALAALLRNLLENALRHVPAGGQVKLIVQREQGEAVIDVIDNGEGIPPERRAAVFARFHREAGSRGDGYGLGLSIVQRATQMHDASIALLDSPYGRGLRVSVRIPLSRGGVS